MTLRTGSSRSVRRTAYGVRREDCARRTTHGARRNRFGAQRGFTLIELMITISILSLGLVSVQGTFLRFADLIGRYSNSITTYEWMDQKIWETRYELFYAESPAAGGSSSGTFTQNHRDFYWTLDIKTIPAATDTYSANLKVGWQQGRDFIQLSKSVYVCST